MAEEETRTTEESNLGKIANIIVALREEVTEIYIATEDGEYGHFQCEQKPLGSFRFQRLSAIEYISKTQLMQRFSGFEVILNRKTSD